MHISVISVEFLRTILWNTLTCLWNVSIWMPWGTVYCRYCTLCMDIIFEFEAKAYSFRAFMKCGNCSVNCSQCVFSALPESPDLNLGGPEHMPLERASDYNCTTWLISCYTIWALGNMASLYSASALVVQVAGTWVRLRGVWNGTSMFDRNSMKQVSCLTVASQSFQDDYYYSAIHLHIATLQ